ncbi:hypothetical protein GNF10_35340 [Nostoc sp. UCD121]|jgi:PBP1b-binding outer membrane lipoprotein LpoB|uniref:hypothetical protein n=1 Tax=unclassified Nostoc TaxID=2593658 RepID=UPI001625AA34|nr:MULTISPECIES: hypothetical protein [unclassified Nostoc]MBC1225447.1 hypothetical protein [Nostoc sp. UCD120]MBC1281061.1 hypothetical protein [Nostoc sp. UCD121]
MLTKKLASAIAIGFLLFGCAPSAQKPITQAAIAPPQNTTLSPVPTTATIIPVDTSVFDNALSTAIGASTISRTAQSDIDRELVVNKWEEAIALMKSVPPSDKNYAMAQKKIIEYRKNLSTSLQKPKPTIEKSSEPSNIKLVPVNTTNAQNDISEVMNSYIQLVLSGEKGDKYFCSPEDVSTFFAPRSAKVLNIGDEYTSAGGGRGAYVTVQMESSNKGGSPIINNWKFVMQKSKGTWCIGTIFDH